MSTTRLTIAPGTHLVGRFIWLVVVPTAACLAPWAVLVRAAPTAVVDAHLLAAWLPVIGVVSVLGYSWISRDRVRLAPFIPFALAVGGFVPAMIDLAHSLAAEPDGAQIPVVPYGIGFLLPFLAAGCGCAALTRAAPRTPA